MSRLVIEMKRLRLLNLLAIFPVLLPGPFWRTAAQSPSDNVEKALAYLRQIDPAKVATADEEKVAGEIEAAWKTIRNAGDAGSTRLKQAITRPGESDYFKLNGAALLWRIGGLDEAGTIASVWQSTRLEVQSNYVFYPAFEAAMTQDVKALPMLLTVLGNDKFQVYVVLHAMEVKWPTTMHFIWGVYGPKGLPVLLNVLKTSQKSIEVQSAIFLFANDQYLDALPRIRELAHGSDPDIRRAAVYALGLYGHPQDYDFLVGGLRSPNSEDRFYYAMAVYEYEDLRAVPQLIPLLNDSDQKVRHEAFANLAHLLTSESLDAIVKYAQQLRGEEKAEVDEYLRSELKEYGLTLPGYLRKSVLQKAQAVDSIRRQREARRFVLGSGEKGFTHAELVRAAEEWKKSHHMRMSSGDTAVTARQILAGVTPADINLLLEVKAAVLGRLSDECLYEVKEIDAVVKRLSRSRYRKDVGITEKVETP